MRPIGGPTGPKVILNEEGLVRAYVEQGLPTTAMQGPFGCSYPTIIRRLRAAGVEIRNSGSYSWREIDVDTLVDLYLDGWSVDRVAFHLGCSPHLVTDRLDDAGFPRRSGSPHGGVCGHNGVLVKTDSGWEAHLFVLLRDEFGEDLYFQGEFGERAHKRTSPITLDKPSDVRSAYLPNRVHYHWTPDFYIAPLDLHVEAKGWHAREKWDSVILPSILHSGRPNRVAVLTTSPYRARTWVALEKLLCYVK
jgi:hypothetical protein